MTNIEKMRNIKTMIEEKTNGKQKFVKADSVRCDNDAFASVSVRIHNNFQAEKIGLVFCCDLRRTVGNKSSAEMQSIIDEMQVVCDLVKDLEKESIELTCEEFMQLSIAFSEDSQSELEPHTMPDIIIITADEERMYHDCADEYMHFKDKFVKSIKLGIYESSEYVGDYTLPINQGFTSDNILQLAEYCEILNQKASSTIAINAIGAVQNYESANGNIKDIADRLRFTKECDNYEVINDIDTVDSMGVDEHGGRVVNCQYVRRLTPYDASISQIDGSPADSTQGAELGMEDEHPSWEMKM